MKTHNFLIYSLAVIGSVIIFISGCSKDDPSKLKTLPATRITGTITDVDGNVYSTVIIGDQQWMAENLKVTRYNNGNPINTGLSDSEWQNTMAGAFEIYPHEEFEGVESGTEITDAWGLLYNWHAIETGSLCPAGWHIPGDEDWKELTGYMIKYYAEINSDNVANYLKSCRQVDSPLGGNCNSSGHPGWNSHYIHYGTNDFGFSALPGGYRGGHGDFYGPQGGYWWSATKYNATSARGRYIHYSSGTVERHHYSKNNGFSVRCIRGVE